MFCSPFETWFVTRVCTRNCSKGWESSEVSGIKNFDMLRYVKMSIHWAVFLYVFSLCLIVCALSCTCACFARFVAIGFLQARCSSFGVLALKKGSTFKTWWHPTYRSFTSRLVEAFRSKIYGKQPPRFHAAEAGVAGLEGMESVGPAMAAAAFLLGARWSGHFGHPECCRMKAVSSCTRQEGICGFSFTWRKIQLNIQEHGTNMLSLEQATSR